VEYKIKDKESEVRMYGTWKSKKKPDRKLGARNGQAWLFCFLVF